MARCARLSIPDRNGNVTWTIQTLNADHPFDGKGDPQYNAPATMATVQAGDTDPVWYGDVATEGRTTSTNIIASFDQKSSEGDYLHAGYHLGGVRVGEHKFLWKTSPSTFNSASNPTDYAYWGPFPTDGAYDIGNGVGNAGGVVMTIGRQYHLRLSRGELAQTGRAITGSNITMTA